MLTPNVEARFWSKVEKGDGDDACWLWKASVSPNGYGKLTILGRTVGAHRFAYESANGKVAPGMVLDHLCRVKACVRPSHLEAVTDRENVLRGVGPAALNAKKTHCKRGHKLSCENVYPSRSDARACRVCSVEQKREYYQRNRQQRVAYSREYHQRNREKRNAASLRRYHAKKAASTTLAA